MNFEIRKKSHHSSNKLIQEIYPQKRVTENDFLSLLSEKPKKIARAIYVHTPYCDKICSFCNLNREQLNINLDNYTDYIVKEFEKYGKYRYFTDMGFDAIYFGGGTPTVYNEIQLKKILKSIEKNIIFKFGCEFTFETTLHNLNLKKIELMNRYGVNRLSIGIQSFSDEGRKFYNRTYSKQIVIDKILNLKKIFKGEICVDIIYNYPEQRIEQVVEDAKIIKQLDLASSSFYSLMIHNGSSLSQDIENKKLLIRENLEKERELHDAFVHELIKEKEYYILELTKIAKKNRDEYKYIKTRNFGGDTFPIGIGAGGNVGKIGIYRMNKEISMYSEMSDYQKRLECFSTLFQFPKIIKQDVKTLLEEKELKVFNEILLDLKANGYMLEDKNNYLLTEKGLFWGNNIAQLIFNTVIEKTIKLDVGE